MKFTATVILIAFVGISGFGWDWPDDPKRLRGLYGSPADGHFKRGITFTSEGQRIRPWTDGELVWISAESLPSVIPSEPEVVIQHADGFRTIYSEIEGRPDMRNEIREGEWIGYAESDSWTFQIADSIQKRIVDPLGLLPERIIQSSEDELTLSLFRDTYSIELQDNIVISSGLWNIALSGIYVNDVSIYWLGEGVASFKLNSLKENDGFIVMDTPEQLDFDRVYDKNQRLLLSAVPLNLGVGQLEIRYKDVNGRTLSRIWQLSVNNL